MFNKTLVLLLLLLFQYQPALADSRDFETTLPPLSTSNASTPVAPGEAFLLNFSGVSSSQAPIIAAWNKSIFPNESVTITGTNFTLRSGTLSGSDTVVWVSDGKSVLQAQTFQVSNDVIVATIPAKFTYSMYLIWVENEAGISTPAAINSAEAQWIGPLGNVANPGKTKRIFGKNLSSNHGLTSSYIYLKAKTSDTWSQLSTLRVSPFDVEFLIPPSTPPGDYEVRLHNGHGGKFGWSEPLSIKVESEWIRGSTIVSLSPNGVDDTAAINNAINSLNSLQNGGTVSLAGGTYKISSSIIVTNNVRLKGAGKSQTLLEFRFSTLQEGGLLVRGDRVSIEDLTLSLIALAPNDKGNMRKGIFVGDLFPTEWSNVKVRSINVIANDPIASGASDMNGGTFTKFEMSDSEWFRPFGIPISDSWLHDNKFHGGNFIAREDGAEAAIASGIQTNRIVIENNDFSTPDWIGTNYFLSANSSKLIARRVMSLVVHVGSHENLFIAGNRAIDVAPPPGENKGEQYLFHGEGAPWFGQAVSSSGTRVTVRTDGLIDGASISPGNYGATVYSGPLSDPLTTITAWGKPVADKMFLSIVGGTGLGQLRKVKAVGSNWVEVDSTWRLPPDSTSKLVMNYVYKDIVIYNNYSEGFPTNSITADSASCFAQFDGNSWYNVVESNVSKRTGGGIRIGAAPLTQDYWNEVRSNDHSDLIGFGNDLILWENNPNIALIGPATLGNAFRSNKIQIAGPQSPFYTYFPPLDNAAQFSTPGGRYQHGDVVSNQVWHKANIVEGTIGIGGRKGLVAGDWSDTLFRNSSYTVSSSPNPPLPSGYVAAPAYFRKRGTPILSGNTYSGASTNYGLESGAQFSGQIIPLQTSMRVKTTVDSTGEVYELELLRNGTTPTTWIATSSSSSLQIINSSGTIDPESTAKVRFTRNSSNLNPGNYWSTIKIDSGDNSPSILVGIKLEVMTGKKPSPPTNLRIK